MPPLEILDAPSTNFDARRAPPDMVVLHYTGMQTGEAALARLRDPEAKVSSHYLVEEDGRVFRLVPEERRAWHAGKAFWKGERDINAASVGIEIVNPGHEFGYRPFPDAQIDAVIALVGDIRTRWQVPDGRILGHSDVAPARKEDPGELFPWRRLAEAGHGLWFDPDPAPGATLKVGDEGPGVFVLQAGLHRLGYEPAPSGKYDAETETVVTAFQRHWRPDLVDGCADGETRARLMAILRLASVETVTGRSKSASPCCGSNVRTGDIEDRCSGTSRTPSPMRVGDGEPRCPGGLPWIVVRSLFGWLGGLARTFLSFAAASA